MAKTMTFATLHFSVAFSVAFSVGYAMTGSALVGGAIALVEPAINTVVFFFHEKFWSKYEENKSEMMEMFANQAAGHG